MKLSINLYNLSVLLPVCAFAMGCSPDDNAPATPTTDNNNVETAQGTDDLSSLINALAKAYERQGSELISTLSGDGPFTVLAQRSLCSIAGYPGRPLQQPDGF